MSLPWLFQVDTKGWCANASNWPIKPSNNTNKDLFELLQKDKNSVYQNLNNQKLSIIIILITLSLVSYYFLVRYLMTKQSNITLIYPLNKA